MKKYLAAAVLIVLAGAATAQARVSFNVHVAVPVAVAPAPVATVVGYPGYAPQVEYEEVPSFIYSPNLGFHVSVGVPHDIAYIDNSYYLYRGGAWYLSPSYRGPWSPASRQWLPQGLHKHRYDQIRYYRDLEYRSYLRDRDHYRGRWYRPAGYHGDRGDDRRLERRDGMRNYRRDGVRDYPGYDHNGRERDQYREGWRDRHGNDRGR